MKNKVQERRPRPTPQSANLNEQQLRELLIAGEVTTLHDRLQSLAEAHQLTLVGGLLKSWCREGSIELAQWSLVLSNESDPQLSLSLNAEALSNPSDIIREIAAAELENVSGIRFTDTAHARSWLANQGNP